MAHLKIGFRFFSKILSDTNTKDVVEVRHIKLRQESLLRIQEVDPRDETTTYLNNTRLVKDLPPKLKSIETTEWISLVNPSNPIKIIIPNYL